jgi:hypothetical protein
MGDSKCNVAGGEKMIWNHVQVQQTSGKTSGLDRIDVDLALEQSMETARLSLSHCANESLSVDDFEELLPSGD